MLKIKSAVRAFDDFRRSIVAPDCFDEPRVVRSVTLGDEDIGGAAKIPRRLAKGAAWEQIFIAERSLAIDQDNLEPMTQVQVLHPVIKDERIAAHVADGVECRAD